MSFGTHLSDAFRLATWRAPLDRSAGMRPGTAFGLFAAGAIILGTCEYFLTDPNGRVFNPDGINSLIAAAAVQAFIIVLFARSDPRSFTIRNLILLHLASIAIVIIELAAIRIFDLDHSDQMAAGRGLLLFIPAFVIWVIGAARQAFKVSPGIHRPLGRAVAFTLVSILAAIALPDWPVATSRDYDRSTANVWEVARSYGWLRSRSSSEDKDFEERWRKREIAAVQLEAKQSALLGAAIDALERRDPDVANVFAIGVAGWSYQDVFMLETQQSMDIINARFQSGKRELTLINNTATENERPMASIQNIAAALQAVGARMNPDRDVLILTLTSHGSPEGFALNYGYQFNRTLDPDTLKIMLDQAGIKNRILIVSSCYSGGFIAPLSNADTVILTAASANRTSFGCANDRKWTYFGEAFFEKGLTGKATIAEAFETAKTTIATWESEQKLQPSEPQIFVGDRIAHQFPDLVGKVQLASGAAVDAEEHVSER